MILELADIAVTPGSGPAFESALAEARAVIGGSPGFRSLTVRRGIESPDRYVLLIEWETLEAHVEGFRESPAFGEWRALIGPYFDGPPTVEHFVTVELPG